MQLKNAKLKISLPNLSLNYKEKFTLSNILNALEILLLFLLPFFVLLTESEITGLENWVTFIYLILLVRVIKLIFFGTKAFPYIEFDLLLLMLVTGLLILTIYHQDGSEYGDLGGTAVTGIGVIMLSGLTVYLFITSLRSLGNKRLFLHSAFMALTLSIFYSVFSKTSNINLENIQPAGFVLSIILFAYSFLGLGYFRRNIVRYGLGFMLFFSLAVFLITMSWGNLMLLVVAKFIMIISLLLTQDGRQSFISIKDSLQKFNKGRLGFSDLFINNYGFFTVIMFLILLIVLGVGYVSVDRVQLATDNLIELYRSLPDLFDDTTELVLGSGFGTNASTFMSYLSKYGLVGMVGLLVLLYVLTQRQVKNLFEYRRGLDFIFAMMTVFLVAMTIMTGLRLVEVFMYQMFTAFVYVFSDETINTPVSKKPTGLDHLVGKLNNPIFFEVLRNVRLLFVIALIVFSPEILNQILELF